MKSKRATNKSFGIVFFVVFFLIGIWPILEGENSRIWSLVIAFVFLVLGLFKSKLLTPLNKIWVKFGELLGIIIAPVVMALVFFAVVTPIGIILKIFGKDVLNLNMKKKTSYWIERKFSILFDKQF